MEDQMTELGLADAHGVCQHSLEHRFQLTGRTADEPEDLGGRGLMLQRLAQIFVALAQLLEDAGVLDGDDGLRGEVRHQFDLLLGERAHLLAINDDGADELVRLKHWHAEYCPRVSRLDDGDETRITFKIGLVLSDVEDMEDLFGIGNTRERRVRNIAEFNQRLSPIPFDKGGRRTVHRDRAKGISLAQEQVAELRLAEADRVCQHGLEHWLQRGGRAANDAQHLRGRRLLLQGLAEVVRALAQLIQQASVLDGDNGLGGKVRYQLDMLACERPDLLA